MKENVVKLMMAILLIVLSMPCFSFAPPGNGDAGYFWIPDSGEYLPFPPERPRMPPIPNPAISASFSRVTNNLYLFFTMDLGDATITIRKEDELIYCDCLLIEDGDSSLYSLRGYGSGQYIVTIEADDRSEYTGYLNVE